MDVEAYGRFMRAEGKKKLSQGSKKPVQVFLFLYKLKITRDRARSLLYNPVLIHLLAKRHYSFLTHSSDARQSSENSCHDTFSIFLYKILQSYIWKWDTFMLWSL